ncbi:MFS transporter [Rummeliibacillus sp. JY-2-4R]
MEKKNSSYRWIVFCSVLIAYLLIVSQRTAPGLIANQLMNDFSITASAVGLMTSIQFLAYSGLQIPVGLLSDRFGPNRFLIIGALLSGLGTVIYSLAPNEYILYISRLMAGIGDSTIWVNLVLILNQWFKVGEFTRLLGVAGMAGSLGSLLATVPFSYGISMFGWRTAFFSTGIVLSFLALLLYFVLLVKPKRMAFEEEQATKQSREIKGEKTMVILKRLFSTRQAWATFFCHFGIVGTYIGFIGSWGVPYGMDVFELSRSSASQLIMYGLIGAIIGAPLTSWFISRRENMKGTYLIIQIVIFLSWMTLFFAGNFSFMLVVLLFFIIGFGCGASSLTFAIVRKSFQIKEVGVATGFANTGGFISAVLLPALFGKVLDHFHHSSILLGYHYGLIIAVVFSLIGVVGSVMIKEQRLEQIQENA